MRKINILFSEYAKSHRNPTNKLIHWICVPLIFFSILGFISLIPSPHYCFSGLGCMSIVSTVILLIITLYYFRLSLIMGISMLLLMIFSEYLLYQINISLSRNSWILYALIFIAAWIFQFVGHKIEGKKPSFIKDLQFLLVGPIWLLAFIYKRLNIPY